MKPLGVCIFPDCDKPHTIRSSVYKWMQYCEEHSKHCPRAAAVAAAEAAEAATSTAKAEAISEIELIPYKCTFQGCDEVASYKNIDREVPTRCEYHYLANQKPASFVNCTAPGCVSDAGYGNNSAIRCLEHRQTGDRYFARNRCNVIKCKETAVFNVVGSPPKYCMWHMIAGMVSNPVNVCTMCDNDAKLIRSGRMVCYDHGLSKCHIRRGKFGKFAGKFAGKFGKFADKFASEFTVDTPDPGVQKIIDFHAEMDSFVFEARRRKIMRLFADDE